MATASGIAKRVVYAKESVFGEIADPTNGQTVRRVTSNFNLTKETYQSDEIRTDFQVADFRHGVRAVEGNISGELSAGTYSDFIGSALARNFTTVSGGALGTSTIDVENGLYIITRSSGDFKTEALKVGQVIRLNGASTVSNNGKNLLVVTLAESEIKVVVLNGSGLVTESVDNLSYEVIGKTTFAPDTGHTDDSYTIEEFYSDIRQSEVTVGNKVNTVSFALPATGLVTTDIAFMGQDLKQTGVAAHFTNPAVQKTTGVFASVNGALIVNGKVLALVTGLNININRNMSSEAVVGSNIKPEIYEGRISVDGDFSTLFQDRTFSDYFDNETEVALVCAVTETNAPDANVMTFTLPRIKLSSDTKDDGEKGVVSQNSFTALKGTGVDGFEATTIQIQDSAA